jgi:hypothetical protein
LIKLLKKKPLIGVAEAFEKLRDPRAIPHLVSWLEEDFVAERAGTAIRAYGRTALPVLFDSLSQQHTQYDSETGMSQRRRARILEILSGLVRYEEIHLIEGLLSDPIEAIRLNAARAVLSHGNCAQKQRALAVGIRLLDSTDRGVRADCEEILTSHFDAGAHLIEHAIRERRLAGEPESRFFPRESTLAILLRIHRKGSKSTEVPG